MLCRTRISHILIRYLRHFHSGRIAFVSPRNASYNSIFDGKQEITKTKRKIYICTYPTLTPRLIMLRLLIPAKFLKYKLHSKFSILSFLSRDNVIMSYKPMRVSIVTHTRTNPIKVYAFNRNSSSAHQSVRERTCISLMYLAQPFCLPRER